MTGSLRSHLATQDFTSVGASGPTTGNQPVVGSAATRFVARQRLRSAIGPLPVATAPKRAQLAMDGAGERERASSRTGAEARRGRQDGRRDVLRRPGVRLPVDAQGRLYGAAEALRAARDDPVPAAARDEAHERGDLRDRAGAVAGALRPPARRLRDDVPGPAPARPGGVVVEVPRPAGGRRASRTGPATSPSPSSRTGWSAATCRSGRRPTSSPTPTAA